VLLVLSAASSSAALLVSNSFRFSRSARQAVGALNFDSAAIRFAVFHELRGTA